MAGTSQAKKDEGSERWSMLFVTAITAFLSIGFAYDGFGKFPSRDTAQRNEGIVLSAGWHHRAKGGPTYDFTLYGNRRTFRVQRGQVEVLKVDIASFVRLGERVDFLCSPGGTGLTDIATVYELNAKSTQLFSFDQYLVAEADRRTMMKWLSGVLAVFTVAFGAVTAWPTAKKRSLPTDAS